MKTLLRLAKKSAKNIYKVLKNQSPIFCTSIDSNIVVTKLFFNHIVNNSRKKRTEYEIIERILIITYIKEILNKGVITQIRKNKYGKTFRISYSSGIDIFCVVILKTDHQFLLLSCFRKTSEFKKRDLS